MTDNEFPAHVKGDTIENIPLSKEFVEDYEGITNVINLAISQVLENLKAYKTEMKQMGFFESEHDRRKFWRKSKRNRMRMKR